MSESIEPGALYIVSTPIGNLGDITIRAVKILGGVDLIAAEDTRKTRFLLDSLDIRKPLLSYYSYNQNRRGPELIEKLKKGTSVAVVTDAGTPGISDPAFSLIQEAITHGVKIIPIPGASAVLPALILSGLPTDRFVFEGFLPVKKGRRARFAQIKMEHRTVVIYEAPYRLKKTLEDICTYVGDRRVAVAREMTKKFEEVLRGRVSEVIRQMEPRTPKGEFVIVIAGATDQETEMPAQAGVGESDANDGE
jgi:16S rRNA (cytidine1402-2'-O)-methyltransferase